MNTYKKIVNGICHAFEFFAVFCLAAMFIMILVQVTGRYVFNYTPRWTEEMARQCVIIFTFIGMAIGVREKIHIGLTIVVDSMDRRLQLAIEIFGKLLIIMLGIMISINMSLLFSMLKYNRLPGSGIPILYIYAFPTALGVLVALIAAYQLYDHIKYGTDEEQKKLREEVPQAELQDDSQNATPEDIEK